MPFKPGQSGNPSGRPKHQGKFLKLLVKYVKPTDWRDIVLKAIEQSKRGDKSARQFLADYCLGRPPQQVDIGEDNKLEIIVTHADDTQTPKTT